MIVSDMIHTMSVLVLLSFFVIASICEAIHMDRHVANTLLAMTWRNNHV